MLDFVKGLARRLPHGRHYYQNRIFRRVSERTLARFLRELGIASGMLVYVQSSFGSIGYYPKGVISFLNLLRTLLGPDGTLVMPSFPFVGTMEQYVDGNPVFDVRHTPSVIGLLPEVLRSLPEAKRSIHPTHPVIAIGRHAQELVEGHENSYTPQGPLTPFAKMVAWGGHVLRIGTPAFPFCHHLQETIDYPNLFRDGTELLECRNTSGEQLFVETRVYRPRVPFLLYMDGDTPEEPCPMNIIDFPVIFSDGREDTLLLQPTKAVAVRRLMQIRDEFKSRGKVRIGSLKGCTYDLMPLSASFPFATAEASMLIRRYLPFYALPLVLDGLRTGQIRL